MDLRICTAIAERRLLMFGYGGMVRVVEPHAYGRSAEGNEILSAWMRPGWSRTNPEGGWRIVSWEKGPDDDVDAVFSDGQNSVDLEVFCNRGRPTLAELERNTLGDD